MCMVEGEDNPELIEKIENTIQNYFLEWSRYDRNKKIFDIVILLSAS